MEKKTLQDMEVIHCSISYFHALLQKRIRVDKKFCEKKTLLRLSRRFILKKKKTRVIQINQGLVEPDFKWLGLCTTRRTF